MNLITNIRSWNTPTKLIAGAGLLFLIINIFTLFHVFGKKDSTVELKNQLEQLKTNNQLLQGENSANKQVLEYQDKQIQLLKTNDSRILKSINQQNEKDKHFQELYKNVQRIDNFNSDSIRSAFSKLPVTE